MINVRFVRGAKATLTNQNVSSVTETSILRKKPLATRVKSAQATCIRHQVASDLSPAKKDQHVVLKIGHLG